MNTETKLIKAENSALIDGFLSIPCSCLDNHTEHIKAHSELLKDRNMFGLKPPTIVERILYFFKLKEKPELTQYQVDAVLNHIQEHIELLKSNQ